MSGKFVKSMIVICLLTATGLSITNAQSINNYNVIKPLQAKEISKVQDSWSTVAMITAIFPFNPVLMIEEKRFYAGITKEFSFGIFPFGRLAAEYSLIFRKTHLNHLRFSYNFDILLSRGDFAAVLLSIGGGYFTDFFKKGFFPQTSLNILVPLDDNIAAAAYFKLRNTFMTGEKKGDIFDISFGLATSFYF